MEKKKKILEKAQNLGREFVIQVQGTVIERVSKNPKINTGAIEILAEDFKIMNASKKVNLQKLILDVIANLRPPNSIKLKFKSYMISEWCYYKIFI